MQLIAATALRGEARQRQERDENPAVLRAQRRAARRISAARGSPRPAIAPATRTTSTRTCAALDAVEADEILVEQPPGDDAWLAVRDRLARAAAGSDDDRD